MIPLSITRDLERAGVPEEIALLRKYKAQGLIQIRSTYTEDGVSERGFGVLDATHSVIWYSSNDWAIFLAAKEQIKTRDAKAAKQEQDMVLRLNRPSNTPVTNLNTEERRMLEMSGTQFRVFIHTFQGSADPKVNRFRYVVPNLKGGITGGWTTLVPDANNPFL